MFKKVKNLRLSEVMNTWSVNQCRFAVLVIKLIITKKKSRCELNILVRSNVNKGGQLINIISKT